MHSYISHVWIGAERVAEYVNIWKGIDIDSVVYGWESKMRQVTEYIKGRREMKFL